MAPKSVVIPPPLTAQDKFGFAYKTIKDRLPVILVKVIDFLHRHRNDLHKFSPQHSNQELSPEVIGEIQEDGKLIVAGIAKLRKELETNKPTELFQKIDLPDEYKYFNEDIEDWNKALDGSKLSDGSLPRWFDSPWLLVECYLYRRLKDIVLQTKHLKMFDPFVEIKRQATIETLANMKPVADRLCESEKVALESANQNHPSERTEFTTFMHLALWANKCDLSINMMNVDKTVEDKRSIKERLEDLRENILCDNLSDVWFKFQDIKTKVASLDAKTPEDERCKSPVYIDLVADNSGYELFVDLCLIHFLTIMLAGSNNRHTLKVRINLKRMPWFVSDCMKMDLDWMIDLMKSQEVESSLAKLAQSWTSMLESGMWEVHDHHFWTQSYDYSQMSSIAPDLYETLSKSSMIIFKGDLNYRKLVGDLKWHLLTPFKVALRGFEPAPLVTLRTSKADVVVGIEDIQIYSNINNNELPRDWMVSGNYALIQCNTV